MLSSKHFVMKTYIVNFSPVTHGAETYKHQIIASATLRSER